ncbi:hypothetical protein MLD38_034394 [Melastoma candidum]|uniref:Uncharacterized protein n=1 Tax=Melastoma candidum TaxID=119954 RepID=A0ACB9MAA6_9MYRT|nr:hypothetical protein MLD38_034394 [Melastoma candidum]
MAEPRGERRVRSTVVAGILCALVSMARILGATAARGSAMQSPSPAQLAVAANSIPVNCEEEEKFVWEEEDDYPGWIPEPYPGGDYPSPIPHGVYRASDGPVKDNSPSTV